MGKKTKQGKARRDVYYRRAKEAGYRARSAYKLVQLNKMYNFLPSAKVCIDLCAAPGSWMQVATKFMPVSSIIIGVDLYPISPIPNTISLQGDITTEKVRQDLKANLKTWKADVVLHDGAPNVGKNWLQDAYQQNLLVLHAFKLACEFLQKGGNFVTKVFRSKDHLSLNYIFKKLFKRVESTKPIASRFESAEIFVICMGYLCPDKIDPKFFDPSFVFENIENVSKNTINLLKPEKNKRKAHGYEDGITMLYKKKTVSDFIKSPNFLEILEISNELEFDNEFLLNNSHTTSEITEFCKDIKVLGRKDIKALLTWRKNIREDLEKMKKEAQMKEKEEKKEVEEEEKVEKNVDGEIDEEMKELEEIQKQMTELKEAQAKEERKKRKKTDKRKKKLEEKLKLRLMVPGDSGPVDRNDGLFRLETLNMPDSLEKVLDRDADDSLDSSSDSDDGESRTKEYYDRKGTYLDSTGTYHKTADDSETSSESESDSDVEGLNLNHEEKKEKSVLKKKRVSFAPSVDELENEVADDAISKNPLVTDLIGDEEKTRREMRAERWFGNELFDGLADDDLLDFELDKELEWREEEKKKMANVNPHESKVNYEPLPTKERDVSDWGTKPNAYTKPEPEPVNWGAKPEPVKDSPKSDSEEEDSDSSDSEQKLKTKKETVEKKTKKKKGPNLTPLGKALATRMIHSKKTMRDMYDDGWNRYMHGDEKLPDFFEKNEQKFNKPFVQVDPQDLAMYQEKSKNVDTKTIKKAVEAKARKARRAKSKLKKVRKKATEVTDNDDMSAREKAIELKKIYKKASLANKRKEKQYVVMKKSFGGKRPPGIKGPSKMVDRRMKKEKRAAARKESKKRKKSK